MVEWWRAEGPRAARRVVARLCHFLAFGVSHGVPPGRPLEPPRISGCGSCADSVAFTLSFSGSMRHIARKTPRSFSPARGEIFMAPNALYNSKPAPSGAERNGAVDTFRS